MAPRRGAIGAVGENGIPLGEAVWQRKLTNGRKIIRFLPLCGSPFWFSTDISLASSRAKIPSSQTRGRPRSTTGPWPNSGLIRTEIRVVLVDEVLDEPKRGNYGGPRFSVQRIISRSTKTLSSQAVTQALSFRAK